jgi:hypothetical protein
VIDLDQPAQNRTPPDGRSRDGRRRFATARALVLIVVGSFLAGATAGGVAMQAWRYEPLAASVEARSSVVSVLLFAGSEVTAVRHEQRRVRIETQVTVVNAGPETVNVLTVDGDQPGVTVRSPERARRIAPGAASPVDVVVEWNCAADQSRALAVSVTVQTEDEQVRKLTPVALDDTPWLVSGHGGCAKTS